MRNPLQDSLLSQSAVTAGVAASRGEMEKDAHHEEAVLGAGGILIPLAVESLGLWSPVSLNILRNIAVRTTNRSGASATVILWNNCQFVCGGITPICFCTSSVCCLSALCGN